MKKIIQTPLFVLIGLVILSLTIFLCGLNISSETISAIITAIYIPLTIYLIIISINTSKDALKITILQNLYNDFQGRIMEFKSDMFNQKVFSDDDMQSVSQYYKITYNPDYFNAPLHLKKIIRHISDCYVFVRDNYTTIVNGERIVIQEFEHIVQEIFRTQAIVSIRLISVALFYERMADLGVSIHNSELHPIQKKTLIDRLSDISKYFIEFWSYYMEKDSGFYSDVEVNNYFDVTKKNDVLVFEVKGKFLNIEVLKGYKKLSEIISFYENQENQDSYL